jgi:ABC-type nitrate/sulfonate/bicarbonate transport system substrate-binding protein/outer membrane protein OmpA-like peptidoglycan-associated protein
MPLSAKVTAIPLGADQSDTRKPTGRLVVRYPKSSIVLVGVGLLLGAIRADAVEYTTAHPLATAITTPVKDCAKFSQLPVPIIAWGGDMPTIYANGSTEATSPGSLFAKQNLSVKLYREDRLAKQIEDFLSCKTPFLRGTLGMVAQATDVLNADPRTKPVVIYQLTWSEGGDVLVVKDGIKEPKDLTGKKIVLQAYGPHVDYLATVLKSAGIPLSDVTIQWVKDITAGDKGSVDPAKAFREDPSVRAAFVISPDANALTSGGKIGTGAEDSVKGAHVLLSTKTASRIIADVYVVRRDWFDANQDTVFAFVHALMLAQEASAKLMSDKQPKKTYDDFIKASAKMLLGSADSTADAEGMWGDARFVGWKGNVQFLADDNFPRNLAKLSVEASEALIALKLITKPVSLAAGALDYARLSEGLAGIAGIEASRFSRDAVEKLVRDRQQTDKMGEGRLFSFEIRFAPNQQAFTADLYGAEFDRVIGLMSTYGGALLTIEGHADTLEYLKRKQANGTTEELSRMKQGAKNLTLQRANAVRDALLDYARHKGQTLDPNQFATVGDGFMKPNVPGCVFDKDGDITAKCAPRTKDEWDAMRRVVFGVVSVESEADTFQPLK